MIAEVTLKNILSFKQTEPLELTNLSVLIGPNGSGKSNFIEIFGLLQAAPRDLASAIRAGGGANEWIWKGKPDSVAEIHVVIRHFRRKFHYSLKLRGDLRLEERLTGHPNGRQECFSVRWSKHRRGVFLEGKPLGESGLVEFDPEQSLLSQIRDPVRHSEISRVAKSFDGNRLYRDWRIGPSAIA